MNHKKPKILYLKSVAWLVIASFILATVLPLHYHLEHESNTELTSHGHVVDLHSLADKSEPSHFDEENDGFAVSPDGTVKNQSKILLALLLAFLFLVIPVLRLTTIRSHIFYFKIKQSFYLNSALLRAPPLH